MSVDQTERVVSAVMAALDEFQPPPDAADPSEEWVAEYWRARNEFEGKVRAAVAHLGTRSAVFAMNEPSRWYPDMPPALPGETDAQYTDRLTGADRTGRVPYDHRRNRQCSIGYHDECSDPAGLACECPCHRAATPERDQVTRRQSG